MNDSGWTKLAGTILTSTIWQEPDATRIVWITMLALKNAGGFVPASIPGLANVANVSIEDTKKALEVLSAPDQFSRSIAHEGRRIEAREGGWIILNHDKHRKMRSKEERKEYQAQWVKERRQESRQVSTMSTHTDTDTDTKSKSNEETKFPDNLDNQTFKETWGEWIAYRKQAKLKPYVPLGERKQLSRLSKWGPARAIAAICFSIANGWQGIFESNDKSDKTVQFKL